MACIIQTHDFHWRSPPPALPHRTAPCAHISRAMAQVLDGMPFSRWALRWECRRANWLILSQNSRRTISQLVLEGQQLQSPCAQASVWCWVCWELLQRCRILVQVEPQRHKGAEPFWGKQHQTTNKLVSQARICHVNLSPPVETPVDFVWGTIALNGL